MLLMLMVRVMVQSVGRMELDRLLLEMLLLLLAYWRGTKLLVRCVI